MWSVMTHTDAQYPYEKRKLLFCHPACYRDWVGRVLKAVFLDSQRKDEQADLAWLERVEQQQRDYLKFRASEKL
jgi:hypothetical protein